jgi:hypothetical protein
VRKQKLPVNIGSKVDIFEGGSRPAPVAVKQAPDDKLIRLFDLVQVELVPSASAPQSTELKSFRGTLESQFAEHHRNFTAEIDALRALVSNVKDKALIDELVSARALVLQNRLKRLYRESTRVL